MKNYELVDSIVDDANLIMKTIRIMQLKVGELEIEGFEKLEDSWHLVRKVRIAANNY